MRPPQKARSLTLLQQREPGRTHGALDSGALARLLPLTTSISLVMSRVQGSGRGNIQADFPAWADKAPGHLKGHSCSSCHLCAPRSGRSHASAHSKAPGVPQNANFFPSLERARCRTVQPPMSQHPPRRGGQLGCAAKSLMLEGLECTGESYD